MYVYRKYYVIYIYLYTYVDNFFIIAKAYELTPKDYSQNLLDMIENIVLQFVLRVFMNYINVR